MSDKKPTITIHCECGEEYEWELKKGWKITINSITFTCPNGHEIKIDKNHKDVL